MRPLKNFNEFVNSGVIQKRKPDLIRAKSLLKEAEKRKMFLDQLSLKIGLDDCNANYFIENSYDIILELLRSKLFMSGLYASGEGAHEAEVAYMGFLGFSEKDVRVMNELRYFRNGILYYGKNFEADYAGKIIAFLNRVYPLLRE